MSVRLWASGAWRTPSAVRVWASGAWRPVKAVYLCANVDPLDGTPDWRLVANLSPPDAAPSNVTLGKGPALTGPETHTCGWSTTASQPESGYGVRVKWYRNGALNATDNVAQGAGSVARTYDVDDDVYCRVSYTNEAGQGPETQTSTV